VRRPPTVQAKESLGEAAALLLASVAAARRC
jgi:hypothetical protein